MNGKIKSKANDSVLQKSPNDKRANDQSKIEQSSKVQSNDNTTN